MGSLGSLGKPRNTSPDTEPVTFDWFGTEVRVIMDYNQVELLDLMEAASSVDENDPAALTIVKRMLRLVVAEESFDAFWAAARENWQTVENLVELSQTLMEASTDRPTRQPSDFSSGRQVIDGTSLVVSDSQGRHGRPDLQVLRDDADADRRRLMGAAAG